MIHDRSQGTVLQPGQVDFERPFMAKSSGILRLAIRLLAGESPAVVCQSLVEHGLTEKEARFYIAEIGQDRIAADLFAKLKYGRKLASLLDVLALQLRQSPDCEVVPSYHRLPSRDFYKNHYYANRPAVLKGYMDTWPAMDLWSPTYFSEQFGDRIVQVTSDRDSDPQYEDHFPEHCSDMTMSQLVALVTQEGGNNVYLVGKNRVLEREGFEVLRKHFSNVSEILTSDLASVRMFFGGAQTVTPLHHDATNSMLAQVYGRKLVRLVPSFEIDNIYNDRTCFSDVNPDNIDYQRFPKLRGVKIIETILNPGEILFLPIGWWHQVRALDVSISLSFGNFSTPNGPLTWDYPLH
jgi:hypothetical protein